MPPRAEDAKETKSAPSPSQAFKLDGEMIGYGVSAVFGVIATITQHDHWLRTPEQCSPISEPLQRIYSRLPVAKRKKIMEQLDPAVLLAGIYQVAGPSLTVELQLSQARRSGAILPPRARDARATAPPAGGPVRQQEAVPEDPGKIADLTGTLDPSGAVLQ